MKTFITLLMLALTASQNAFAQKAIKGTKELPLEMNLMIESYQSQSADNFDKILPVVLRIDQYARALNKEDIFLIGKVEVYKTLLKNYDAPIKIPVDGASITTLQTALTKSTDNFTKWFIQALLKDAQDLINNPVYKEFLLQKNSTVKMEKPEYRRLEKKGELLQFWISKITPEAEDFPDTLKKELGPKMLETLKSIQNSFYFMAKEATLGNLPEQLKGESELKFFAVSDVIPMAAPKKDEGGSKSVEDILAPLTDEKPPVLPKPSQENWLEDENAPSSLQNLPKPTNDADWLQDF